LPHLGDVRLDLVEELGPVVDVAPGATGHAVADQVEPPDLEPRLGETVAHGLVPAGVLGDAVHEDDRGHGFPLGVPVAHQLGAVLRVWSRNSDAQSHVYRVTSSGNLDQAKPLFGVNRIMPPPPGPDHASGG